MLTLQYTNNRLSAHVRTPHCGIPRCCDLDLFCSLCWAVKAVLLHEQDSDHNFHLCGGIQHYVHDPLFAWLML